MTTPYQSIARQELLAIVHERRKQVRAFVDWAQRCETNGHSMYLANRKDICDARKAVAMYPDGWWGVVVFTCFGSLKSTRVVRDVIAKPVGPGAAKKKLDSVHFTRPKVGHHRIQQGLLGAKRALVAACQSKGRFLHEVLHKPGTFDDRYQRLRRERLASWGRTTCFDLLVRTGAIGIGGHCYAPEIAYLADSTGPKEGFLAVWGQEVTREKAAWCECLLQAWCSHWEAVVKCVDARWSGRPYAPGDLENALCIYQKRRDWPACSSHRETLDNCNH